ncbi:MAG: hypothetical protein WDW38_004295 [Sanguina aurantia]
MKYTLAAAVAVLCVVQLGTGQNLIDISASLTNLYTNSDFSDFLRVDRGYLNLIGNLELDTFAKAVAPAIAIYAAELSVVSQVLSTVAGSLYAAASAVSLYAVTLQADKDAYAAYSSGGGTLSLSDYQFQFMHSGDLPITSQSSTNALGSVFHNNKDIMGQLNHAESMLHVIKKFAPSY